MPDVPTPKTRIAQVQEFCAHVDTRCSELASLVTAEEAGAKATTAAGRGNTFVVRGLDEVTGCSESNYCSMILMPQQFYFVRRTDH